MKRALAVVMEHGGVPRLPPREVIRMSRPVALGVLAACLLLGDPAQAQRSITVPSPATPSPAAGTSSAPVTDQVIPTAPPQQMPESSSTARPGDGAEPAREGTAAPARSASNPPVRAHGNPILGNWRWSSKDGRCKEHHEYRADGTATVRSGDEVLQKSYTIERYKGGAYFLVHEEVKASNGGKDCTGQVTAVGKQSGMFVLPTNDGGYYTCSSDEGWGCFGTASRVEAVRKD
jgi:hypothetical protein